MTTDQLNQRAHRRANLTVALRQAVIDLQQALAIVENAPCMSDAPYCPRPNMPHSRASAWEVRTEEACYAARSCISAVAKSAQRSV
jgi:hypothetical protein